MLFHVKSVSHFIANNGVIIIIIIIINTVLMCLVLLFVSFHFCIFTRIKLVVLRVHAAAVAACVLLLSLLVCPQQL